MKTGKIHMQNCIIPSWARQQQPQWRRWLMKPVMIRMGAVMKSLSSSWNRIWLLGDNVHIYRAEEFESKELKALLNDNFDSVTVANGWKRTLRAFTKYGEDSKSQKLASIRISGVNHWTDVRFNIGWKYFNNKKLPISENTIVLYLVR